MTVPIAKITHNILISTAVLLSMSLIMNSTTLAASYEEISTIEKKCESSSNICLKIIDSALTSTTKNTRPWNHLKRLQLDALFNLQKFDILAEELAPLLANNNLPVNFAVYVYIFHAKLLLGNQEIDLAKQYLNKSVGLLHEINNKYPNPLRLIDIANVQIVLKDYEQANKTLLQLESKFTDRYHPVFKRELYANLGHVAYFQHEENLHITYREKSLKWAIASDNNQQIGIAHSNLAWAYFKIKNYKLSEKHYRQAVKISEIEQDEINGAISKVRLTEVILLQGNNDKANKLFDELTLTAQTLQHSEHFKKIFQALKIKLNR